MQFLSSKTMKLEDLPLQFDDWITFASELEQSGKWDIAAWIFRHIASIFGNEPGMMIREANALYHFGDYRRALQVIGLMERPTIASYLIEARCYSMLDEKEHAIDAYKRAERILNEVSTSKKST